MTQHYLAGELSLHLEQLQAATTDNTAATRFARLRHEAETAPLTELTGVAAHALELADCMCWESLTHADAAAFVTQAAASADLWEFSICAGLLHEPAVPKHEPRAPP